MSIGQAAFQLAFQLSPIILVNGIAQGVPGNMLPIITFTEALNFAEGIVSQGTIESLNDFFCHFRPLPGATLADNAIGHYPFANQYVAANAIIFQPLKVSLLMDCPVKGTTSYAQKFATLTALQAVITKHNLLGGTYIVATPSYLYTNCLLLGLRDVSTGESRQAQNAWQWDFEQPLLTLSGTQGALNNQIGKIGAGLPSDGSSSGLGNAISTISGTVTGAFTGIPASLQSFGASGSTLNSGPIGNNT